MTHDRYTHLFERSVFPILDRLNGTTIAEKLDLLLRSEHIDPATIAARQSTELQGAVERAGRSSAFYRDFWRRGAKTGIASNHPILDGLPVLTKTDLRQAGSFPPEADRVGAITAPTSGSTGSPMTFYRSREQDSWFWALRFRIWAWAGYRPGDPYLTINLNPRLAWRKRLQDRLFRCSYLTYNADNQDSARIVRTLRDAKIQHLNGFSSSLYALARYMNGNAITNPGVLGITGTGDALYPAYRDEIESAFGVRVLDYYGAGGEGVHLASQCRESGSRYHILPENALVEILDDRGPVPPGTPGRIVVTQFHNDIMPLLRYEVGDVAVAAPEGERCPCGRTLPLLEKIEGRIPDLIVAANGTLLVTHFFVVLFKAIQEIERYQVVQEQRDRVRVRLVARPGADRRAIETEIRDRIASATSGALHTDFVWSDDIPLSGNGKRRLVISRFGREALRSPQTAAAAVSEAPPTAAAV